MEKLDIFDQINRNKRKSIFLVVIVFLVLFSLIYLISKILFPEYLLSFLLFGSLLMIGHTYFSYNHGDKLVLNSVGAKPASKEHVYLHNVVEGLSIAAGIPKPKVFIMPTQEINAFACGKSPETASICISQGALDKLNRKELEGVIGHEISHIANYDVRFMTLVAVFVGLVAIVSHLFLRSQWYGGRRERKDSSLLLIGIVLAVLAPIATRLVQLAISRKREFLADASSAQLTRYPEGLASALEKIEKYNKGKMNVSEAVSHLFFTDPNRSPLDAIFATHPDIRERIRILRSM